MVELCLILLAAAISSSWRQNLFGGCDSEDHPLGQMFFAAALPRHLVDTVVGHAMLERRGIQ